MSEFVCMLPFPDGNARKHRDLSWFGQEKALRPAGEESLYYFAPKCLYRGEYKRGMECGDVSCTTTYGWCVMLYRVIVYLFLGLPFYSSKEKPRVQL